MTMKPQWRDKTQEAAYLKVSEHLEAIRDLLCIRECPIHEKPYDECSPDDCDVTFEQAIPHPEFAMTSFLLLTQWVDLATGDSWLARANTPSMTVSQVIGILEYQSRDM